MTSHSTYDAARLGLAQYPSTRANAAHPVFTAAVTKYGGVPSGTGAPLSMTHPHVSVASTSSAANGGASATAAAEPRDRSQGRLSGGQKRDHAASSATDGVIPVDPSTAPKAAKRPKITYQLPHQNMEEGHFYVTLGEDVDVSTGRFKILSLLGEGTFGKVVEAWDRKYKMHCAVKIVRNIPKYSRDAQEEIKFMERVRSSDPDDKFAVMKILRYFQNDQKHMCIVMPKYGPCLLDTLQKHGPLNHRVLAEVAFHAAAALDFLHTEMRLMHTDLKPENMLLESDRTTTDPATGKTMPMLPARVRLCDLGGCCNERHTRNAIVSTRHYRSPEVILGLGWMFSTDMWSMGCILYELYTGRLLFDTHDNLEHLHLMEKVLTRLPSEWSRLCMDETKPLFSTAGTLRSLTDPKHLARVARARPVREVIQEPLLRDLIQGLLCYDRTRRLTARDMSTHPYVAKYFPEALSLPLHPSNRGNLPPTNH